MGLKRLTLKIGGRAFENGTGLAELGLELAGLEDRQIILVHGGGAEISRALQRSGHATRFIDGVRVTSADEIEIVERVLSHDINTRIAETLQAAGVRCRRMSGRTQRLFRIEPLMRKGQDLGRVGRIVSVNPEPLFSALDAGEIPVVSPISEDDSGLCYNVNADSAAAAVAAGASCTDLVYYTDVPGVQIGGETLLSLTESKARALVSECAITGGMIAKLESSFEALHRGVARVHITSWQGGKSFAAQLQGGTVVHH